MTVIDEDVVESLARTVGAAAAADLLQSALDDLQRRVEAVKSAQPAALADHVHALATAASITGATVLAARAGQIEEAARRGTPVDQRAAAAELERLSTAACAELRARLDRLNAPASTSTIDARKPPLGWLTWKVFAAVAVGAVLVRIAIPTTRAGQIWVVMFSLVSVGAMWIGASRMPPGERRPGFFIAAGASIYLVGDVIWYYNALILQTMPPRPSLPEIPYNVDDFFTFGGVLLLIRRRNPSGNRGGLIDAAIIAIVAGLLTWVYVAGPILSATTPVAERVVSMKYVVEGVALVALAGRLLLLPGRRPPADVFLTASGVCVFAGDFLFSLAFRLPGLPVRVEAYYLLYLLYYAFAAIALLHPSFAAKGSPAPGSAFDVRPLSLVLLGAAVLVPSLILAARTATGAYHDVPVIVGALVVIVVLVMVRMTGLMQSLRAARRQAELANEAKGAFLATMSHEMRTPLNAVIGLSELVLRSDLTTDQRENLETVTSSGRILLGVINDVLDFSKAESGSMELEQAPFALADCIESAIRIVAPEVEPKQLWLRWSIGDAVPTTVAGDVTRLRQILVNLLSNAVKFTETGGIELRVRLDPDGTLSGDPHAGEGQPLRLRFSVADTGIGIPAEAQLRIFDAFAQVDASATRRYGGTGLGLAISRRLCELMGGRIWVESEPGVGSTFSFTAVLRTVGEGVVIPRPAQDQDRRATWTPTPAAPSLRILVVEDNAVNQDVARRLLGALGFRADVAASGREAVEAIEREGYDLVLMDMRMPELDGPTASRMIRERWPSNGPRIVAMTANASPTDRQACLDAGMDDFLAKPITLEDLSSAVRRALSSPVARQG